MESAWITCVPQRIINAVYVSVKTTFKSILAGLRAALEISGFCSEDGFGSVRHRTPRSCFSTAGGREETEHLARVGGAKASRPLIGRESSLVSVSVVSVWF